MSRPLGCIPLPLCFFLFSHITFSKQLNPVFAVNCGGDAHVDSNGVLYSADFNDRGIASGYGLSLLMRRTPEADAILYQTERYDTSSFYYEFPFPADGQYVLHLKFSEVWFQEPNGKVFSVELNGGLRIIENLDIFKKVGFAVALDENIPLTIKDGSIRFQHTSVRLKDGEKLRITFVKGDHDNPKVNAIALFKNSLEDIPKLLPLDLPDIPDDLPYRKPPHQDVESEASRMLKRSSLPSSLGKPPAPDPYAYTDYSAYVLPILIALATFLPLVFCLYRL